MRMEKGSGDLMEVERFNRSWGAIISLFLGFYFVVET